MSTQTPSSEHQFVVWEDSLCFTLMGTFPLFDKLHCWHLTLWSHSTKRVVIKTILMSNVYLTHLSNPKSQPSQSRRDQLICNSNFPQNFFSISGKIDELKYDVNAHKAGLLLKEHSLKAPKFSTRASKLKIYNDDVLKDSFDRMVKSKCAYFHIWFGSCIHFYIFSS